MLRRSVIALLVLTLCAAAQNVRITFVGQSCFVIETLDKGPVVVADPPPANFGYYLPTQPADVVTVSHNHGDHNNVAGLKGTPAVVDGRPITTRQETTAAGMSFVLIPGFHDNQRGLQRGPNTIIRWSQGGLSLAHLGDHGQAQLTDEQAADLKNLDVMIVPAGGFYTIDAAQAAALVTQLKPRVAILMHYRTALGGPAQLVSFPAVVQPFGEFRYKPASAVVSRTTLPQATEVWLMEPVAQLAAVNAAGFSAGMPMAPGSLASLFGDFAGAPAAASPGAPLPRKLGEVEVMIGTPPVAAPLLYVSPTQVNLQLPSSVDTGQHVAEVRVGGKAVARGSVTVIPVAPGVFAAVAPDGRLNRVRAGQTLTVYATGQGEVAPAVADGTPAPARPLPVTPVNPDVFIGYKSAPVLFSGLAPGWIGLWQLNVAVPPDVPAGTTVPLVVNRGITSNALYLVVEGGSACPSCTCPGC
ncbi:MAG: hypothetical protein FJW34_12940 [Acidobacteria bacterium]|nr:hypothetical protein [Acidobacteriota bacterium]